MSTVAIDTPRPGTEWAIGTWPPVIARVPTTIATRVTTHAKMNARPLVAPR